jgi:predicted AlkP superfamily pyrophosphatase or phosphodiesterase
MFRIVFVGIIVAIFSSDLGGRSNHVILITVDGLAAYHLMDESLEIPHLRELIAWGTRAVSSEAVFPSVTHPSHTTLITGRRPIAHGVLDNRMRNRTTGETYHVTNKLRSESIKVPTLFDAAKQRGLTTAAFFWPETKGDRSIDFNVEEAFEENGKPASRIFLAPFLAELGHPRIPFDLYPRYYDDPQLQAVADVLLAEAAAMTIGTHRPHLLAIHFLITDKAQHRYGPAHYLAKAAITHVDRCIGILRESVRTAGIEPRTTFIVAADHGFHSVYKEINLYPLFEEAGLQERVALHPDKWALHVELKSSFDPRADTERVEGVLKKIARLPGVSRVIRSEEYPLYGLPRYEDDSHIPGQFMIVATIDNHLVIDPGSSSVSPRPMKKPYHGHGYLPEHPRMYPALVLSGNGIAKGKQIGHVRNLDVAPTIGHLLKLQMGGLEGRVLKEALTEP